ncbi:MAG TPA: YaaR family protein [bacterium]|nr:YaaR family protein [bacterium]
MSMKIEKVGDGGAPEKPSSISELFAPALTERMKQVGDPVLRAELSNLIVEVEEKGKKLLAGKGRREFENYKRSVKKFMDKVVASSFKLEEKHGHKKDGKFVVYLTMQKVDGALDILGQMLLAGQQDPMRLIAALDEIRGMLLDTYL